MRRFATQPRYEEIQELFHYCIKIGIKAKLERMCDGYAIRFLNGSDFVQHSGSYGCYAGCVEPNIGCRLDFTAVPLKRAMSLVQYHKERLNKEINND